MQAQLLLESAAAMKSKTARDGAFAVLTACALKYGQLEAVAGAAVAALTRNEHMAVALAELAEYSQAKYDDSRLVSHTRRHLNVCSAASSQSSGQIWGTGGGMWTQSCHSAVVGHRTTGLELMVQMTCSHEADKSRSTWVGELTILRESEGLRPCRGWRCWQRWRL